jgi:hypothetical protein
MEMAGGKWNGKVTTTKYDGTESKVWIADKGYFGGFLKMQFGDNVTKLVDYGDDGKALLKWKDEKKDKADAKNPKTADKPKGDKEEKKDDGKDDEEAGKKEDKKD